MKNISKLAEMIWKSAVGATGSTDLAGGLATDLGGMVLLSLEGEGVFDTIKAFTRRAAYRTPLNLGVPLVAEIVGEGLKIPVSKYSVDRAGLTPVKVAGLAVGDNSALRTIEGAAWIAEELRQAVITATDLAFLTALALDAETTESATADVPADLKKLLDAVNLRGSNKLVWAMAPTVANYLCTLRAGTNSNLLFPDMAPGGGNLLGLQALVTAGLNGSDALQLIDPTGIVTGAEDLTIKTTTQALVEMDSDPNDSGSEAIQVSLFQTDATGLLGIRSFAAKLMRPCAVGVLNSLSAAWDIGTEES